MILFTSGVKTIRYAAPMGSPDRRSTDRVPAHGLIAVIRRKGRITRLQGAVADFNRHGMAMVLDQPLPKDTTIIISLTGAGQRLDNLIGVVHNCISADHGFRCGIQFRTRSGLQHDCNEVEAQLATLESVLVDQDMLVSEQSV